MRFKSHTVVVIALVVMAIVLVLVSLPAGGAANGDEPVTGARLDREGRPQVDPASLGNFYPLGERAGLARSWGHSGSSPGSCPEISS